MAAWNYTSWEAPAQEAVPSHWPGTSCLAAGQVQASRFARLNGLELDPGESAWKASHFPYHVIYAVSATADCSGSVAS